MHKKLQKQNKTTLKTSKHLNHLTNHAKPSKRNYSSSTLSWRIFLSASVQGKHGYLSSYKKLIQPCFQIHCDHFNMATKSLLIFCLSLVAAVNVQAQCDLGVLGGCIFGCPQVVTNQTEQCEFLDCFLGCFDDQPDCKTDPTQAPGYNQQLSLYSLICFNEATGCNILGLDTCMALCNVFNFSVPEERCPLIECALSCFEDDFPECITDPFKAPTYQQGKALEPFCTDSPTVATTPAPR